MKDFEDIEYLLNKDELEKRRSDFIVLVARVLKEFFKCVEALGDVIPKHISHRCSFVGNACLQESIPLKCHKGKGIIQGKLYSQVH